MTETGIELDYTEPAMHAKSKATTPVKARLKSSLYADMTSSSSSSDSSSDGEIVSSDEDDGGKKAKIEQMAVAITEQNDVASKTVYRPSPTNSELPGSSDEFVNYGKPNNSRKRSYDELLQGPMQGTTKMSKKAGNKGYRCDFDAPPPRTRNEYAELSQQVENISFKQKYEALAREHNRTLDELEAAYTAIQCLITNGRKYFEKMNTSKAPEAETLTLKIQLKDAKASAEDAIRSREKYRVDKHEAIRKWNELNAESQDLTIENEKQKNTIIKEKDRRRHLQNEFDILKKRYDRERNIRVDVSKTRDLQSELHNLKKQYETERIHRADVSKTKDVLRQKLLLLQEENKQLRNTGESEKSETGSRKSSHSERGSERVTRSRHRSNQQASAKERLGSKTRTLATGGSVVPISLTTSVCTITSIQPSSTSTSANEQSAHCNTCALLPGCRETFQETAPHLTQLTTALLKSLDLSLLSLPGPHNDAMKSVLNS